MLAAFTVASGGCSLVYTRGPQPSASSSTSQPEPCTSTNGYAIADTVLAAVFFTALAGGTVALIDSTQKHGGWSGLDEGLTGIGLMVTGFVGTALFTPSAVVGYNRAAACRAWEALPPPLPTRSGAAPVVPASAPRRERTVVAPPQLFDPVLLRRPGANAAEVATASH